MRVFIALLAVVSMASPAMAEYRILSDDRFEARRVVAVELLERARASELGPIADAVKSRDSKAYERTVINFYLPSMSLGDGSWATVSYSPERLTTINGLTREEEVAFIAKVASDNRDRVGSWIASSPALAGEVTIFSKDGLKFVEWTLRSGLTSVDEVFETRTWRGRRFDIKTGSKTHFLINSDSDLEIRDSKGLIATGERILAKKRERQLSAFTRSKSRLGAALPPEAVTHQIIVRRGVRPGALMPDPVNGANKSGVRARMPGPALRALGDGTPVDPVIATASPADKARAARALKARTSRRAPRTLTDLFKSNLMQ